MFLCEGFGSTKSSCMENTKRAFLILRGFSLLVGRTWMKSVLKIPIKKMKNAC